MKTCEHQVTRSDQPSPCETHEGGPGSELPSPDAGSGVITVPWATSSYPRYAAHFYAAALDLRPDDTETRMRLADCRVRCNQPTRAAQLYLEVASDYAHEQRPREATAIGHYVLHLDPRLFVYGTVADMLRQLGRHARPLCTRAAELHIDRGRTADALGLLSLGAELDPHDPGVHRQLARLLASLCMLDDAQKHFECAGRLLLTAGNNADYIDVAEELLGHCPRHLATLQELPRVLLRVDEPEQAVVKIYDLMRVNPGDLVGFELLAHAYAVLGHTQTSRSILERLVGELDSTGRRPQATAIIERASGWRPDDPSFEAAAKDLSVRPLATPRQHTAPYPIAQENTLELDVADLIEIEPEPEPEPKEILDATALVELIDTKGSVSLRLEDFPLVDPAPDPTLRMSVHPVSSRIEADAARAIEVPDTGSRGLDRKPATATRRTSSMKLAS
ncbi:MAG: hypothetical protein AAGF11_43960 [Myxococcota bacterium]